MVMSMSNTAGKDHRATYSEPSEEEDSVELRMRTYWKMDLSWNQRTENMTREMKALPRMSYLKLALIMVNNLVTQNKDQVCVGIKSPAAEGDSKEPTTKFSDLLQVKTRRKMLRKY